LQNRRKDKAIQKKQGLLAQKSRISRPYWNNHLLTWLFWTDKHKHMKKVLKWIAIIFSALFLLGIIAGLILHESRPAGTAGPAAEALAKKMTTAINKEAWDSTRYVQWTFAYRNSFIWDKEREVVQVTSGDTRVLLRLGDQTGLAYQDGNLLEGEAAQKALANAWAFFCNDSFWLNAPAKAFDPGTKREIVDLKDGSKGLLVTYSSGGVTPGDSYLWILDEEGLPTAWKMWVSIIPIGGGEFSWESWETLPTGAKIATLHKGLLDIPVTDLKAGQSLEAVGLKADPFAKL
jgi:hypothetical protein